MAFLFATASAPIALAEPPVENGSASDIVTADDMDQGRYLPLPDGYTIQRHVVGSDGQEIGGVADIPAEADLVYSNTSSAFVFSPGNRWTIADDVVTVVVGESDLAAFTLTVSGQGDGSGEGFSVDIRLFDDCPTGSGVWNKQFFPAHEPWVSGDPVPAALTVDLPNDGVHEIEVVMDPLLVAPATYWMSVKFNKNGVGWLCGSPATVGFTANRYHYPTFPCDSWLQGTPYYAGFNAKAYHSNVTTREFIAYYNPQINGGSVPGTSPNEWTSDDIRLIVDDCELSALEVGVAVGGSGSYTVDVELWRYCGENFVIEGTQRSFTGITTGGPALLRFDYLDEALAGLDLGTEQLWVAWRFNRAGAPVFAAEAELGTTEDYWGDPSSPTDCDLYYIPGGVYSGLSATVRCLGEAPVGACCDHTSDVAVCTDEVPQIGCSGAQRRWEEGAVCPVAPGDPDPFDPPCGHSACCLPSDLCENRGQAACVEEVDEFGNPALWQRGSFCNQGTQDCPRFICLYSEGDCGSSHPTPGCDDPTCCDYICGRDSYCCTVEWDSTCVSKATQEPPLGCVITPANDRCPNAQAMEAIDENADPNIIVVEQSNLGATTDNDDPGFCCFAGSPGSRGSSSLWYTFVAKGTSAQISTCGSTGGGGDDSVIGVYTGTCGNMTSLACNDDAASGCAIENNSRLDVFDLTVDQTYYLLLASKSTTNNGPYRIRVTFPSPHPTPPDNDVCESAEGLSIGVPLSFDMEDAMLGCPSFGCAADATADMWYQLLVTQSGVLSVETCDPAGGTNNPATVLSVYSGLDCSDDNEIACNDDASHCSPGSIVFFPNQGLGTYRVRLGDENGSEPAGTLTAKLWPDCDGNSVPDVCDLDCGAAEGMCAGVAGCGQGVDVNPEDGVLDVCAPPPPCPDGVVTFVDPIDGMFDARQPHTPAAATPMMGIDTFVVTAPAGGSDACWSLCETDNNPVVHPGVAPNGIASVVDNGGGSYTITLDHPIMHGELTTLTYTSGTAVTSTGSFYYMPGDVNDDGTAAPADILSLIDSLNGVTPLPDSQTDADRDGTPAPADILRVIDLLNGAGVFAPYLNVTMDPVGCP